MRLFFVILAYCLVAFSFAPVVAEPLRNNESVLLLGAPFEYPAIYVCGSHWKGDLKSPGDDLGRDCYIQQLNQTQERIWATSFRNKGHENSDWYGWEQPVLAMADGKVIKQHTNSIVNKPGIMGKGHASYIIIERQDGVRIVIAHLQKLRVKVGDLVKRGQVVGRVGNNGYSRHPHIHIGAWKKKQPLQIHFDQRH